MYQDLGLKPVHEITMLIVCCGDEVVVMFDPKRPKQGWVFPSTSVREDEHSAHAARRAGTEKLGFDFTNHRVRLSNAQEKGGKSFSAFFVEVAPDQFDAIGLVGTRGESVRKIPKSQLAKYIRDPGPRYLAGAKITGISVNP